MHVTCDREADANVTTKFIWQKVVTQTSDDRSVRPRSVISSSSRTGYNKLSLQLQALMLMFRKKTQRHNDTTEGRLHDDTNNNTTALTISSNCAFAYRSCLPFKFSTHRFRLILIHIENCIIFVSSASLVALLTSRLHGTTLSTNNR